jgi:hypothetical protein
MPLYFEEAAMTMTPNPQSGIRVRRAKKGEALPPSVFSLDEVVFRLENRAATLQAYGWPHHAADIKLAIGELQRLQAEVEKMRSGMSAAAHRVDMRLATAAVGSIDTHRVRATPKVKRKKRGRYDD